MALWPPNVHDVLEELRLARSEIGELKDRLRFEAACAAMQGLLATNQYHNFSLAAKDSVAYADFLLRELARGEKGETP